MTEAAERQVATATVRAKLFESMEQSVSKYSKDSIEEARRSNRARIGMSRSEGSAGAGVVAFIVDVIRCG